MIRKAAKKKYFHMKPLTELFDLEKIADQITRIGKKKEIVDSEVEVPVLIEKILTGPLTVESIRKLFSEWGINQKEVPHSPDPATEWATFTKFINEKVSLELKDMIEKKLDIRGTEIKGELKFQLMLDDTFGLYYIYDPEYQSPDAPQEGDIIIEPIPDGSFAITEIKDNSKAEPIGMASDWKQCIDYVIDHFHEMGYMDEKYEYDIRAFLRSESGLEEIEINNGDDGDDSDEYDQYENYFDDEE